ncbi:hypothetical protein SVAN01_01314 [Stagonosporopsis vannaccii]|nr:hypothetical protein SVAN01_01314 [Stagonosporopsis vannaccii]
MKGLSVHGTTLAFAGLHCLEGIQRSANSLTAATQAAVVRRPLTSAERQQKTATRGIRYEDAAWRLYWAIELDSDRPRRHVAPSMDAESLGKLESTGGAVQWSNHRATHAFPTVSERLKLARSDAGGLCSRASLIGAAYSPLRLLRNGLPVPLRTQATAPACPCPCSAATPQSADAGQGPNHRPTLRMELKGSLARQNLEYADRINFPQRASLSSLSETASWSAAFDLRRQWQHHGFRKPCLQIEAQQDALLGIACLSKRICCLYSRHARSRLNDERLRPGVRTVALRAHAMTEPIVALVLNLSGKPGAPGAPPNPSSPQTLAARLSTACVGCTPAAHPISTSCAGAESPQILDDVLYEGTVRSHAVTPDFWHSVNLLHMLIAKTCSTNVVLFSKPFQAFRLIHCLYRPFDHPLPEALARQVLSGKDLTSGVRPDANPLGRATTTAAIILTSLGRFREFSATHTSYIASPVVNVNAGDTSELAA